MHTLTKNKKYIILTMLRGPKKANMAKNSCLASSYPKSKGCNRFLGLKDIENDTLHAYIDQNYAVFNFYHGAQGCAKPKKWAWPKKGVVAEFVIGIGAQNVEYGPKYWFQVRNRFRQTVPPTLQLAPYYNL